MNIEFTSDHQSSFPEKEYSDIRPRGRKRKPQEESEEQKLKAKQQKEEFQEFFELARTRRQGSGRVINT